MNVIIGMLDFVRVTVRKCGYVFPFRAISHRAVDTKRPQYALLFTYPEGIPAGNIFFPAFTSLTVMHMS